MVLCSDDGNLALWPNFCGSDAMETQRLAGQVTGAAAAALSGGAFIACVGTAGAALFCVRAEPSPGGLQTRVARLSAPAAAPLAGQQVRPAALLYSVHSHWHGSQWGTLFFTQNLHQLSKIPKHRNCH